MNLREWQESFLTRSNNRLILNMTKRVSKREKLHILLFNSYFIANFATMKCNIMFSSNASSDRMRSCAKRCEKQEFFNKQQSIIIKH